MRKKRKNHRLGICPACRGTHRVTKDGRMYQHFQKGWMQPNPRACLGTGRIADSIMDDDTELMQNLRYKVNIL